MFRHLFLLALFIFCIFTAKAQQSIVKATVYEAHTRVPLAIIQVRNLNNKQTAITNNDGKFSILAVKNDVLVLTGYAYQTDTLLITDVRINEVFMEPKGTMLQGVTVKGVETHLGSLNPPNPEFHNQTVVYQRNADGSYKGGVAFRISSNHSEEKKREHEAKVDHEDAVRQELDKVFDPKNLAKYLPLKPEELVNFRIMYTPTVKVYTSMDFNLTAYLNTCYKEFKQLPEAKRMAPPVVPAGGN